MKLEVGQFVRTKDGKIGKYFGEKAYEPNKICIWTETTKEGIKVTPIIDKNTIVKASYSIIDILEDGDYVNGEKVGYIDDCDGAMREYYYDYENASIDVGHLFEEIKSIVTHEQMEQIAYKVEE